jgi:hypothetical protein
MPNGVSSKEKAARRRPLLIYFVLVFLLAWWPWNFWLIFGAAGCWQLQWRRYAMRLNATALNGGGVSGAKGLH